MTPSPKITSSMVPISSAINALFIGHIWGGHEFGRSRIRVHYFERRAIVNNQVIKDSCSQCSKDRLGFVLTAGDCSHVFELLQIFPCKTNNAILDVAEDPLSLNVEITSGNIA